ncbi:adaptor protein MecA [Viridibacillus sp. YIM B01967]|uniref:Adapter protein MecA n=1 Tax=Viridibacillus soli TaxID=2798301 RepID=A0ABS1H661_9BACL|nr:adaptor protein MecA [Viridibacillus soli]MBK3494899.1 adaptor protein MecA [Viridibacillus soli]
MDIERINENTLKLFISYHDIEERGFTKDEVWYNREKSEELFWSMMDEVSDEEYFEVEGPLWIQVIVQENGLELTITHAKIYKDGQHIEPPFDIEDKHRLISAAFGGDELKPHEFDDFDDLENSTIDENSDFIFKLQEFDDIIALAKRIQEPTLFHNALYEWEGGYYLQIRFKEETLHDEAEDIFSVITEFASDADVTIHILQEYGKTVMEKDCFETVLNYFA